MLFELYEKSIYFLKTVWGQDISYLFLDAINHHESWFTPAFFLWIILFWVTYFGRIFFKFITLFVILGGIFFVIFF